MADPANLLTPILLFLGSLLSPEQAPDPAAAPVDAAEVEARRILECVGEHESNGDYRAVSPSGKYRGKYQMDNHFFLRYGGDSALVGRHETAPPEMQDDVALRGYQARGLDPWPGAKQICS